MTPRRAARITAVSVAFGLCIAATVCAGVVAVRVVGLMIDGFPAGGLARAAAIRPWGIAFWACGLAAVLLLWFVRDEPPPEEPGHDRAPEAGDERRSI